MLHWEKKYAMSPDSPLKLAGSLTMLGLMPSQGPGLSSVSTHGFGGSGGFGGEGYRGGTQVWGTLGGAGGGPDRGCGWEGCVGGKGWFKGPPSLSLWVQRVGVFHCCWVACTPRGISAFRLVVVV